MAFLQGIHYAKVQATFPFSSVFIQAGQGQRFPFYDKEYLGISPSMGGMRLYKIWHVPKNVPQLRL